MSDVVADADVFHKSKRALTSAVLVSCGRDVATASNVVTSTAQKVITAIGGAAPLLALPRAAVHDADSEGRSMSGEHPALFCSDCTSGAESGSVRRGVKSWQLVAVGAGFS